MANQFNPVVDLRQTDDGDLYFDSIKGDFELVPSDKFHIKDILQSSPGWWKNHPDVGVNVFQFMKSVSGSQKIDSICRQALINDGYTILRPFVSLSANGKLTIDMRETNILRLR